MHLCTKGPTRSVCDSAAETPTPREPDSKNKITITITQRSGERRKNTARVRLREGSAEVAGHSGQRYHYPAVHATSQTPMLPGGCSQPLCSAEGTGHVAAELHHGCAGALPAEEVVHASHPTTLRAEAALRGSGGKGACSEEGVCIGGDDTDISEFSLPQGFCF